MNWRMRDLFTKELTRLNRLHFKAKTSGCKLHVKQLLNLARKYMKSDSYYKFEQMLIFPEGPLIPFIEGKIINSSDLDGEIKWTKPNDLLYCR